MTYKYLTKQQSDEEFDYGSLEYWQTLFYFNGKAEYLEDLEEEDYL